MQTNMQPGPADDVCHRCPQDTTQSSLTLAKNSTSQLAQVRLKAELVGATEWRYPPGPYGQTVLQRDYRDPA